MLSSTAAKSSISASLKPGDDVVLRSGDRSLTRNELKAEAESVAGGLRTTGVEPGDRVAIYAANSLDWVIAYLAAHMKALRATRKIT